MLLSGYHFGITHLQRQAKNGGAKPFFREMSLFEFNDFSLLIRLYKVRHLVFYMLFDTYCIPSNVSEK